MLVNFSPCFSFTSYVFACWSSISGTITSTYPPSASLASMRARHHLTRMLWRRRRLCSFSSFMLLFLRLRVSVSTRTRSTNLSTLTTAENSACSAKCSFSTKLRPIWMSCKHLFLNMLKRTLRFHQWWQTCKCTAYISTRPKEVPSSRSSRNPSMKRTSSVTFEEPNHWPILRGSSISCAPRLTRAVKSLRQIWRFWRSSILIFRNLMRSLKKEKEKSLMKWSFLLVISWSNTSKPTLRRTLNCSTCTR